MSWTVPFPEASELTKLETKHLDHVGGSDEEDEELLKEENRVAAKYTVVANKNRNVTPLGKKTTERVNAGAEEEDEDNETEDDEEEEEESEDEEEPYVEMPFEPQASGYT
jgi:hypothetical protein